MNMARTEPGTRRTVKIRSMLISLLIFLVFGTALVSSYFTITIGAKAVEETKDVGDDGVERAFASGGVNVAYMTKEFMKKVTDDAVSQILAHFGMSTANTEYLAGYVASLDESTVKSTDFLVNFVTQTNSLARANSARGITEYGLLFLKNGHLWYITVLQDPLTTANPPDGFHHFIAIMTLNATHYAEISIDSNGALSTQPCVSETRDPTREPIGYCEWTSARIENGGQTQITKMVYKSLSRPGDVLWAPIHGVLSSVRTLTITSFKFGGGFAGIQDTNNTLDLAVVWSAVVTDGLSSLLKSMELPEGSRLYCIDIDTEDRMQTLLAGANYGEAYDESMNLETNSLRRTPSYVVNSTDNVISAHSRDLLSRPTINTDGVFDWQYENVTNWEAVTALTDKYNLLLHIVLLVPQHIVMADINRETAAVQALISEKHSEMERKRDRSYQVMMILVVLIPMCLLLLSVIVAQRMIMPIEVLSEQMAAVSQMRLDIPPQEGSALKEVETMRVSFERMVDALREYKSYLPQTILMSDDSSESVEQPKTPNTFDAISTDKPDVISDTAAEGHSSGSRGSDPTTSNRRSSSTQRQAYPDTIAKLSVQLYERQNAAFVLLNTKGFTAYCQMIKVSEVSIFHRKWLEACLKSVRVYKGIVERFIADELQVSFGAASSGVQCSVKACRYVEEVRYSVTKLDEKCPKTFIGVSSGTVLSGTLGSATQRGPAVIGQVVRAARVMRQLAVHLNLDIITTAAVHEEAKTHFNMCPVDVVSMNTAAIKADTELCYYLLLAHPENHSEWMYALEQQNQQDPWHGSLQLLLTCQMASVLQELQLAVENGVASDPADLVEHKKQFFKTLEEKAVLGGRYVHQYVHTFVL